MKQPIIIIGVGELGGVFARAFLRHGHPVVPVTHAMAITETVCSVVSPELILVAVGEKALPDVLAELPSESRQKIVLLQNELLPDVWQRFDIDDPTVISVWFEKKKGQAVRVLKPSPVFGPGAGLIAEALGRLAIPCERLKTRTDLVFELAVKNIFVYTINICGLEVGGTTGGLWSEHREFANAVVEEVTALQEHLTQSSFPRSRIFQKLEEGIAGDPDHQCMGRSAPERLVRLVAQAKQAGIHIPVIRGIQSRRGNNDG